MYVCSCFDCLVMLVLIDTHPLLTLIDFNYSASKVLINTHLRPGDRMADFSKSEAGAYLLTLIIVPYYYN